MKIANRTKTLNESWEKEREPTREARSDAEGLTETGRSMRP